MGDEELQFRGGRLRHWQPDDAETLVKGWADPLVAQWNQTPNEPTIETATRWIAGVSQRYDARLSVDFVVDVDDLGVVGEVGLSGFSTKHSGALVGYWLLATGRGHGYATLAVHTMTAWAHATLGLDMIVARCHPSNVASQAVAARCGYRHEANDDAGHQLWRSRADR